MLTDSMRTVFLYALKDRKTSEVRYIGETWKPKDRFIAHRNSDNRIGRWIKKREACADGVEMLILTRIVIDRSSVESIVQSIAVRAAERELIRWVQRNSPSRLFNKRHLEDVEKAHYAIGRISKGRTFG